MRRLAKSLLFRHLILYGGDDRMLAAVNVFEADAGAHEQGGKVPQFPKLRVLQYLHAAGHGRRPDRESLSIEAN